MRPTRIAKHYIVPLLIALPLVSSSAEAINLLVNGSFDSPTLSAGSWRRYTPGQNIGGWTVLGPGGVLLIDTAYSESYNGALFNSEDGRNNLDLTGVANEGLSSGVTQSVSTIAGQTYALSFYLGREYSSNQSSFYTSPASIDLSINGGTRTTFTNSAANPVSGQVNWTYITTSFTATSNSTAIAFYNSTSSPTRYAGLDNVSLTATSDTAVPEPATEGLMAMAFGIWYLGFRRKTPAPQ